MTMSNDLTIMQKKCEVFSKNSIPVHISLKDNSWANGFISEVSDEFIILEEFKKGKTPIFYSEIFEMETYTKEVKDGSLD